MCNMIHPESKVPRYKKGTGYKIFTKIEKHGLLYGMVRGKAYYNKDRHFSSCYEWIEWCGNDNMGFCIFTNKKTALKVFKNWTSVHNVVNCVIKKVEYEEAIAKHKEKIGGQAVEITLVKKFRVIDEQVI